MTYNVFSGTLNPTHFTSLFGEKKFENQSVFDNVLSKSKVALAYYFWPPYRIGQAIIFLPCDFPLLSFFSSPNLSSRRLDVYHTSAHGVALVQI